MAGSVACAFAGSIHAFVLARFLQGIGGSMMTPVGRLLLVRATPRDQLVSAMAWLTIPALLGPIMGPPLGGFLTTYLSWHWIFWINVPIGLTLAPLAASRLAESHGPKSRMDLQGLGLAAAGIFGVVFGLVRSQTEGWGSTEVIVSLAAGLALVAAFVAWELRAREPMLPMRFFANRGFAVTNVVSLTMYFGMFGSIFFLSQFIQNVLGNSPLEAGLKLLVWTGATMVVAPLAGIYSEKFGSRPFMVAGLGLQAVALGWLALEASVTQSYMSMVVPFVLAGAGMALVFAPSASAVLNSVRVEEAGKASGATTTIRELGGTFGIAILATVFSGAGGYTSPQAFVDGLVPALWVGTAVLAAGALVALLMPSKQRVGEGAAKDPAGPVLHRDAALSN